MYWLWRQRHLKKGCNDDARDDDDDDDDADDDDGEDRDDGKDGDAMIARILRE